MQNDLALLQEALRRARLPLREQALGQLQAGVDVVGLDLERARVKMNAAQTAFRRRCGDDCSACSDS